MTFGQKLKESRELAGYEHAADFAKVLGIEENRYRHYERGSAEPGFEMLCKMCQMLEVEPNDLLPHGKRRKKRSREDLPSPPTRAVG
ncbi:MAG: helix-turn-helix transcriptional regulator [Hyphomicrobium sp.]